MPRSIVRYQITRKTCQSHQALGTAPKTRSRGVPETKEATFHSNSPISNRSPTPTCGQHVDNNVGFNFADWPLLICKLEAINLELVQLNTLIWLVIPATKALVRLGTRGKPSHTTPSRQGSCQDHLHNRQSRQSLPILWCCQTLESESFVSTYTDLLELIHLNSDHSCQSMQ